MIYLRSQRNHKFKNPCGAVNSLILTLIAILSVGIVVESAYLESETVELPAKRNLQYKETAAISHIVNIHVQST